MQVSHSPRQLTSGELHIRQRRQLPIGPAWCGGP